MTKNKVNEKRPIVFLKQLAQSLATIWQLLVDLCALEHFTSNRASRVFSATSEFFLLYMVGE